MAPRNLPKEKAEREAALTKRSTNKPRKSAPKKKRAVAVAAKASAIQNMTTRKRTATAKAKGVIDGMAVVADDGTLQNAVEKVPRPKPRKRTATAKAKGVIDEVAVEADEGTLDNAVETVPPPKPKNTFDLGSTQLLENLASPNTQLRQALNIPASSDINDNTVPPPKPRFPFDLGSTQLLQNLASPDTQLRQALNIPATSVINDDAVQSPSKDDDDSMPPSPDILRQHMDDAPVPNDFTIVTPNDVTYVVTPVVAQSVSVSSPSKENQKHRKRPDDAEASSPSPPEKKKSSRNPVDAEAGSSSTPKKKKKSSRNPVDAEASSSSPPKKKKKSFRKPADDEEDDETADDAKTKKKKSPRKHDDGETDDDENETDDDANKKKKSSRRPADDEDDDETDDDAFQEDDDFESEEQEDSHSDVEVLIQKRYLKKKEEMRACARKAVREIERRKALYGENSLEMMTGEDGKPRSTDPYSVDKFVKELMRLGYDRLHLMLMRQNKQGFGVKKKSKKIWDMHTDDKTFIHGYTQAAWQQLYPNKKEREIFVKEQTQQAISSVLNNYGRDASDFWRARKLKEEKKAKEKKKKAALQKQLRTAPPKKKNTGKK